MAWPYGGMWGDVRLYLMRGYQVHHQTKDHSVPQMLADTGDIRQDQVRHHPEGSSLLNSLGKADAKVRLSKPMQYTQLYEDDYFHLSSDGFWQNILEDDMNRLFQSPQTLSQQTQTMHSQVLEGAKKHDSEFDNLTAINIRIIQTQLNQDYWHKTRFVKSLS